MHRKSSPTDFKQSRTRGFVRDDFSLGQLVPGADTPAADTNIHLKPLSAGGHRSEDRIRLRAAREPSPPADELAIRSIKESPPFRHRSPKQSIASLSSLSRPSSHHDNAQHDSFYGSTESIVTTNVQFPSFAVDRTPNARLGEEVPIADKTNILGSSQLKGCPGDFCHLNIYAMSSNDQQMRRGGNNKNGKKDKTTSTDYRKALFQAGLLDSSLDSAGTHEAGPLDYRISFKSIIHARQEMPLVRAQLDRHMRGDDSPYVIEDTYTDLTVGGKLPAHFYQEVPCCQNCFQVYTIIDKARGKAMQRLQDKRDRKGAFQRSLSFVEDNNHSVNSDELDAEDAKHLLDSSLTKYQQSTLNSVVGQSKRKKREKLVHEVEEQQQQKEHPSIFGSASTDGTNSQFDPVVMQEALRAIDGLTKMDVAEIRTMVKPPAAVEVVMEAVVILLTGKYMNFKEAHRLLSGGEAFLNMLKEFNLSSVTEERLRMMEVYVDNPLFRPENVLPVSRCASKFCAWVHGIVHAARYQHGIGHRRIDTLKPRPMMTPMDANATLTSVTRGYLKPLKKPTTIAAPNRLHTGPISMSSAEDELSFVQKLEKMKASRVKEIPRTVISREDGGLGPVNPRGKTAAGGKSLKRSESLTGKKSMLSSSMELNEGSSTHLMESSQLSKSWKESGMTSSKFDPGPTPTLPEMSLTGVDSSMIHEGSLTGSPGKSAKKLTKRENKAMRAMQKKATDRLAAQTAMEGSVGIMGLPKEFLCSDGISRMPYIVMGKFSLTVEKCNFIVIHDFFDTYDATAILFKPIVQRHDEGCQFLCFNYPGQAHTVWPRLSAAEKERGAREPVLNNEWLADRIHEMLSHAEAVGDILLSKPFHLLGIGNGASIAASFVQRYGHHALYADSLRSIVSVNGFLYPDAQLSAILHAAHQVFESTPHTRPDIAVSYWSRFVFSDDYLARVNPNLALNIYTAVSNPISNDGRVKLARGCLAHKDLRGALSPDPIVVKGSISDRFLPIQVPVIVLQSTEDTLVNAANVDSFLVGRTSKHLWSHMLNVPSDAMLAKAFDVNAQWVGRMSTSPVDYPQYSTLGKSGIKMLLDSLRTPRGAFVMWVRAGHVVQQEYKAAVLDLIDVLACPTDDYTGLNIEEEAPTGIIRPDTTKTATEALTTSFGVIAPDVDPPIRPVTTVPKIDLDEEINRVMQQATVYHHQHADDDEDDEDEDEDGDDKSQISQLSQSSANSHSILDIDAKIKLKQEQCKEIEKKIHDLKQKLAQIASSVGGQNKSKSNEYKKANSTLQKLQDQLHAKEKQIARLEHEKQQLDPLSSYWNTNEIADYHPGPKAKAVQEEELAKQQDEFHRETLQLHHTHETEEPVDGGEEMLVSSTVQRGSQHWVAHVPDATSALALEAELRRKQHEYTELEARIKALRAQETLSAQERPDSQQSYQRMGLERDDSNLLSKLAEELERRHREREFSERQRRVELRQIEDGLVKDGLIPPYSGPTFADEVELETLRKRMQESSFTTGPVPLRNMLTMPQDGNRDPPRTPGRSLPMNEEAPKLEERVATHEERNPPPVQSPLQINVEPSTIHAPAVTFVRPPATPSSPVPVAYVEPVRELPPMHYNAPAPLPRIVTEGRDVNSKLDQMLADEEEARRRGVLNMQDFDKIKTQMAERQLERDQKLRSLTAEELDELQNNCSVSIERVVRGFISRQRARKLDAIRQLKRKQLKNAIKLQSVIRGFIGRKRFRRIRMVYLANMKGFYSATMIQKHYRGYRGRKFFTKLQRYVCSIKLQRVYRGYIGRQAVKRERERLFNLRRKQSSSAKIQSIWRMKIAKEEYRSLRINILAVIEIQRIFRGFLGRKKMARRRQWESTKPGPERIKLGLQFIDESKQAFERQQEEIDALHRAQERAESRISHIHAELKDSEKELVVLERELQEIDQIERDLQTLTHERSLLSAGMEDAAGMPRTAAKGHHRDLLLGKESTHQTDPIFERRQRAEAYALEMTIQLKRAEREKKRQELEIEFAAVFQEVEKKRKALQRLELSLADMEATRERKDREFKRLQKNLMQLLLEQKQELDELREKGLELETATATTAAAAVATAQKAKEHEARSHAMFSQTEELMKFQFMSMSLSYFSSLNMLKSLRDMNADTTSAAVALSADAAATAASVATAANLPNVKKLTMGGNDFIEASIRKKKEELQLAEKAKKELHVIAAHPLPDNVKTWTVSDVCRWLDSLSLSQYTASFNEGSVDGPFLLELREEDLVQVLGIRHKLHVKKIMISREKLKPLSQQEMQQYQTVVSEDNANQAREEIGMPAIDTVFSQARNGRNKRVEESLNLGFPVDGEDERGNTLLLVAVQNRNKKLCELLLLRGANINHQNAAGNTALHYAVELDPSGQLAEYLIEHNADDTIENIDGLTPYDGTAK